jgi:DNA-binding MarR family transcriptional regulator
MGTHSYTPAKAGAPPSENDVTSVLDSIRRIVKALRVSATFVERKLGISGAQLFVLQVLRDAPAESLNELAERTHTHQSSVSVVVTRLVERGLVIRERSEQDARRVRLALTEEGRALLREAPEPVQRKLIDAMATMPAEDVAMLAESLRRVTRKAGISDEPAEMLFEQGSASTSAFS